VTAKKLFFQNFKKSCIYADPLPDLSLSLTPSDPIVADIWKDVRSKKKYLAAKKFKKSKIIFFPHFISQSTQKVQKTRSKTGQ
jgi:hypothetical protein